MNTTTATTASAPLSERLRNETAAQHQHMHDLMAKADPFADRSRYARFTVVQYLFQHDVEQLFAEPALRAAVPDLDLRGRQTAALADLQDLGTVLPDEPIGSSGVAMPEALGWLYVSEGSTLGAAFLLKEAKAKLGLSETFGARNLAAYPEGRGKAWNRFVAALDQLHDRAEQDAVLRGAHQAFGRFDQLLHRHFALR